MPEAAAAGSDFPSGGPFGWSLQLDLHGCDLAAISDPARILAFVADLCDDVLGMRRFGDCLLERFGGPGTPTYGWSAVQLIETSSVVIHFAELGRRVYLDVFSCRSFDAARVDAFATACFCAQGSSASARQRA